MTESATVDSPVGAASSRLHRDQSGARELLPPEDVLDWANIWERPILAWTKLDPATSCIHIGCYSSSNCCGTALFMMLFPLCWPIVVGCAPCFCDMLWSMFVSDARKMRHQYWILTPTHLTVITKIPRSGENGGEGCCSSRGDCTPDARLQSIALTDIAYCGIRESRVDLIVPPCCISPSPEIYVNVTVPGSNGTEGRRRTKTAVTAIGMLECQAFVQEVVKQRDPVRRLNNSETLLTVATMDRGDVEATVSTTVEDRIRQIVDLRDQGVLSLAQFEHERQATVDSM